MCLRKGMSPEDIVLAHIRRNLNARAEYIKHLSADKLNEVLEIIMKGI